MTPSYPFTAGSPSDPAPPLGFSTFEAAQAHADVMNSALAQFDTDPSWNRAHWKSKPSAWVVRQK